VAHKSVIKLREQKNYKYKNLGCTTDVMLQVGPKDMGRGISWVKGEKTKRIPAYAGPPVSRVVLKWYYFRKHMNERLAWLVQHQSSSLSQYQVSPPWCSGPCNRVEMKIWVSWSWRRCSTPKLRSATADWSGHVRWTCQWRSFMR